MANLAQAIRMALHYGEENLGVKDIFGQDVGAPLGGVFYGDSRIKDDMEHAARRAGHRGNGHGSCFSGKSMRR